MCRLGKSVLCGKTSLTVAKYRICPLLKNPDRLTIDRDDILLNALIRCIFVKMLCQITTTTNLEYFFFSTKKKKKTIFVSLFANNESYTSTDANNMRQSIE